MSGSMPLTEVVSTMSGRLITDRHISHPWKVSYPPETTCATKKYLTSQQYLRRSLNHTGGFLGVFHRKKCAHSVKVRTNRPLLPNPTDRTLDPADYY